MTSRPAVPCSRAIGRELSIHSCCLTASTHDETGMRTEGTASGWFNTTHKIHALNTLSGMFVIQPSICSVNDQHLYHRVQKDAGQPAGAWVLLSGEARSLQVSPAQGIHQQPVNHRPVRAVGFCAVIFARRSRQARASLFLCWMCPGVNRQSRDAATMMSSITVSPPPPHASQREELSVCFTSNQEAFPPHTWLDDQLSQHTVTGCVFSYRTELERFILT